jgi:hypothetical protein
MDFSQQIGALGGSGSSNSFYSDPAPAAPPPVATTPVAPTVTAQPAFSPAVANAPSPSPEAILADTKNLPANVLYAPSPPPGGGATETHHFDRKA